MKDLMKIRRAPRSITISLAGLVLMRLFAGVPVFGSQSDAGEALKLELREALLRDAHCEAQQGEKVASAESDAFLSKVQTQVIHGARGAEVGVIATPTDACHCPTANCRTYIYLISGDTYKLVLEDNFESVRPMKVIKLGIPSLTAKFRVDAATTENIILNWTGGEYKPGLCATVTQTKKTPRPTIAYHPCGESHASKPPS